MTLSWCVVHDSGWMDNGCFAAEVAEHGDLNDCQMVEMELHPAGSRVVTAETLADIAWQFNEAVSMLREARSSINTTLAAEIDEGLSQIDPALRRVAALAQSKDAP